MEETKQPGAGVTSFLDAVTDLVVQARVRVLEDRAMVLHLVVLGPMPPSWCKAIVAVHLSVGVETVAFRVKRHEQNGSTLALELEPASVEEDVRAKSVIEERNTHFTNVGSVELEITGAARASFANSLYLPKT
jgi:O-acetylhomoserine/O-acetylserine sulfhydrylase-like pyridoxal-dependent enzyme